MGNKLKTVDAETLLSTPMSKTVFIVDGLISQGVNVISGASKIGKSWLMLWLGLQVAQGNSIWGLPTLQCDVLYKFLRRDGDDANDAGIAILGNPRHNRHCRHKPKKGGEQMRSKNYGINVRVTEQEKQKLLENARFCSLSLSEYLRRLGLGKEVKAAITERDYRLFRMLNGLKAELPQLQQEEILSRLEAF